MTDNAPSDSIPPECRQVISPVALGMTYAALSAIFYTLFGICQRAVADCDPVLVNSVQASVSTVVFGVYLTVRSVRGRSVWPPLGITVGLMMLGAITQLGGTSYQWSLGIIGLTIGNPLQMGVMLSASAILGLLLLGERVSWQAGAAIVLITIAILLLTIGAESAGEAVQEDDAVSDKVAAAQSASTEAVSQGEDKQPPGAFWILMGVAAACFAGVAFAILTVGIRKTVTEDTAPEAIVFYINCMGILFLGPWAYKRLGLEGIMATSPRDFAVMLAIGACNMVAFLLIAKAFQLTTVVRVNVINNAVSTTLSVIAGIVIFTEPCNIALLIGISLTLLGIVLISYNAAKEEQPQSAAEDDKRE